MGVKVLKVEKDFIHHGHALLGGRRVDGHIVKRAPENVEEAEH